MGRNLPEHTQNSWYRLTKRHYYFHVVLCPFLNIFSHYIFFFSSSGMYELMFSVSLHIKNSSNLQPVIEIRYPRLKLKCVLILSRDGLHTVIILSLPMYIDFFLASGFLMAFWTSSRSMQTSYLSIGGPLTKFFFSFFCNNSCILFGYEQPCTVIPHFLSDMWTQTYKSSKLCISKES